MRFMIQLWSDESLPATAERVSALAGYNDELSRAGVLLAAEGLVASSAAVRIALSHGERSVAEGASSAERLGVGFWIVRARDKREAVSWAQRCPLVDGDTLEVRQLFGEADFDGLDPLG
jgi:hypothetical protein